MRATRGAHIECMPSNTLNEYKLEVEDSAKNRITLCYMVSEQ